MLLQAADIGAAMSVEGLLATDRVFAADLQALRPHPGQADSASNLRALLAGSAIMASHRTPHCNRVQDAYSLRCSPQVLGAARDTVDYAALVANRELAVGRRQPCRPRGRPGGEQRQLPRRPGRVCARLPGDPHRGRREHGRATYRPVPRQDAQRGPAALPGLRPRGRQRAHDRAVHPGRHRLRAQAAGRTRQRRLDPVAAPCRRTTSRWAGPRPASSGVPSTGWPPSLAIEILTAARGLDLRAPLTPSPATGAVIAALRDACARDPGPDRHLAPEIEAAADLVRSGALVAAANSALPTPLSDPDTSPPAHFRRRVVRGLTSHRLTGS